MFEVDKIKTGLYGLIGLRQPLDPAAPVLSVDNTTSRSGLFVDDVPPFRLETLKETQDYIDIDDTQLNTVLENLQKTAIANVMYKVFDKGGYIDRNYVYSKQTLRKTIDNSIQLGDVLGYEIEVSDRKNLAFKITNCRLEFDFDSTINATIYLMNDFLQEPLYSKQVTLTKPSETVSLNWVVDSTMNDYKGSYFLLIKADNPTERLQPYKRDYEDNSIMNNIAELELEGSLFKSFSITDFKADYLEYSEYCGLNPDITVYEDYTDLILQNEFLFARCVQLEFAIALMMIIATSMRSNRDERRAKEIVSMMMININGVDDNRGLKSNLFYEIKNLKMEVDKLKDNYFGGMLKVDTVC